MFNVVEIRALIENTDFAIAQPGVIRLVRRAVRTRIYRYAQRNAIVDFADSVTVEQTHRNWRQNLVDIATTKAAEVQAATTTAELLIVYDSISAWLE